jgi:uncharacterized coiled-coil DUF342 family protein
MRNYKLEIELSFMAESEATQIMDACHELTRGLDPELDVELVKKFQSQVDSSVEEIGKVVTSALEQRPKIVELLNQSNEHLNKMRQYKGECEASFKEINQTISSLKDAVESTVSLTQSDITKTEASIEATIKRLGELDSIISEAKKRVEACLFLKDMSRVKKTLMTGGKVALLAKDDLGNWCQSRKWES